MSCFIGPTASIHRFLVVTGVHDSDCVWTTRYQCTLPLHTSVIVISFVTVLVLNSCFIISIIIIRLVVNQFPLQAVTYFACDELTVYQSEIKF